MRSLARGYRVRCLVRRTSKLAWLPVDRVELVYGEVTEPESLTEAARGVEVVYHVAGITRASTQAEYDRVNADGCANVARAAAAGGSRRVVLVSSLAAGGPSVPGRARTEDDPDTPCDAYGRSKLRGESALKAEAGSAAWTIVRPPAVYGPRDVSFLVLARLAQRGWVPAIGRSRAAGEPHPCARPGRGDRGRVRVRARDRPHLLRRPPRDHRLGVARPPDRGAAWAGACRACGFLGR